MRLHVTLDVKFRAFGITFGTYHLDRFVNLPTPPMIPMSLLDVNERGVHLVLVLVP